MNQSHAEELRHRFGKMAVSSAQDISVGAVREFVKSAAAAAAPLITASRGGSAHA